MPSLPGGKGKCRKARMIRLVYTFPLLQASRAEQSLSLCPAAGNQNFCCLESLNISNQMFLPKCAIFSPKLTIHHLYVYQYIIEPLFFSDMKIVCWYVCRLVSYIVFSLSVFTLFCLRLSANNLTVWKPGFNGFHVSGPLSSSFNITHCHAQFSVFNLEVIRCCSNKAQQDVHHKIGQYC